MLRRFFQPVSKGVAAFGASLNHMMLANNVSRLFERRQILEGLSKQWPELQPQKVRIEKPEMLALESLTGTKTDLQIGFARKPGLPIPNFPISHSAICFYDPQQNKFFVIGRQSPFALNINDLSQTTRIDNEATYLTPGYNFYAIMTPAMVSEQEIATMIKEANQNINSAQLCDMMHSNCYSNSVYFMADALERMAERATPPAEQEAQGLIKTIALAAQDHMSIGVSNNEVVIAKVTSAFEKAKGICKTDQTLIDACIFDLHQSNVSFR